MTLISISGKKGSGKSTVASLAKEQLLGYDSDLEVDIISFADALKEELAKATGHSVGWIEENKQKLRLLLQAWGTDFRRNMDGLNYWTDKMLLKLMKSKADYVIIPDARFLNELEVLIACDCRMWLVTRREIDNVVDNHPSENEWTKWNRWHRIIENNGPLGELRGTVDCVLQQEKFIKRYA